MAQSFLITAALGLGVLDGLIRKENMAQSFLITAAQGALDGLIRKAEQQMCLGWAFEGDLRKLIEKLTTTQLLLRDAENRKIPPEIIKEWLTKLQSVISDAESVTDELEYETVRMKVEVHNKHTSSRALKIEALKPFRILQVSIQQEVLRIEASKPRRTFNPSHQLLHKSRRRFRRSIRDQASSPRFNNRREESEDFIFFD